MLYYKINIALNARILRGDESMGIQTCCVTGHRDIPAGKRGDIRQALRKEIEAAISDGCIRFISGFADGVDLIFADIIAEMKKENEALELEAAIPYRQRFFHLLQNQESNPLVLSCTVIGIHSEKCTKHCYMTRNRFMVSHSDRVIAVYDGRSTGGTLSTIRFAHNIKKDVRVIPI